MAHDKDDRKKWLWLALALAVTLALIAGVFLLRSCDDAGTGGLTTAPIEENVGDAEAPVTTTPSEPIQSNPVETYVEPAE